MRFPVILIFTLLSAIVLSCADDESALKPAFIIPLSPENDNLYLNEGPYLITVRVTNENKDPLPDIMVKFSIEQGDAELTTAQMPTDANGLAYTYIMGKPGSEPIKLEASAEGLSKKVVFNYGVSKSHTSQIIITGGNNLDVGAGVVADYSLKVKVMDDLGNVAQDAAVKFVVLEGNGEVAPEITKTNQYGEASTSFTGSNTTINNTIAAFVGTDSVFFTLESIYIGPMSVMNSKQGIDVKWSKNKSNHFQKYSLQRSGSDGVYKSIAEFTDASDTVYTDTDKNLIFNTVYTYRLMVHTPSTTVENAVSIVVGETIPLQGVAIDFEIDESRNQLYVSLPELNQIHIFNLTTFELKEKIQVGSKPHGISLSRDKSTLYIALYGSGAVAFMDLTSKQITSINVSDELGDLKAFDVLEGAPGRVFVTGSPQSYGIAFMLMIKTDENNKVERFMQRVVRFNPKLATDYGKYIYVIDAGQLYKLDPYGSYTDPAQEANYVFSWPREFLIINPAGTKLFLDFEVLNTNPITAAGEISARVPALSSDGSVVHYHSGSVIRSYDSSTLQQTKETGFFVNHLKKLELISDNSTFVALGVDYSKPGDVLYFIPNR